MKSKCRSVFVMIVLAAMLVSSCAVQAEGAGILYRVSGGKNEMVILGSIHVGSPDMYPMNHRVLQAMEQSDVFVFECDTQSEQALRDTMEMMYYPKSQKIVQAVSSATYEQLRKAAAKTGYPLSALNGMKPWAVVSLFSTQTTAAEMGTEDVAQALEYGVEKQVEALVVGREHRYLETARQQLEIMDSFSPELQQYMLQSACEDVLAPENAAGASLRFWPQWWSEGNAQQFADAYLLDMQEDAFPDLIQEYHQALITLRNQRMAKKLADMLQEAEEHRFFVTIGLLHMVLPGDSVAEELEKMGYHVERIMP